MTKRIPLAFAVLSLALPMNKALAQEINYTLTDVPGKDVITFSLPANPTIPPDATCQFPGYPDICVTVSAPTLVVDGISYTNGIVDFFTPPSPGLGGLVVADKGGTEFLNQAGPYLGPNDYEALFSGSLTSPTLETFTNLQLLGGYSSGSPILGEQAFVLNARVPEGGTGWTYLLLAGAGLAFAFGVRAAKRIHLV
jgi:hypothetical protein